MIALHPYFKFFHLFALFLWVGSVPSRMLLARIAARGDTFEQRRRAARLLWRTMKLLVLPFSGVAVAGGLGMLYAAMLDLLGMPWMQLKLLIAAVLVVTELGVVLPAVYRTASLYDRAAANQEDSEAAQRASSLATRITLVMGVFGLGCIGVLTLIFSRGDVYTWLIGALVLGLVFVAVIQLLLRRITADIARVLFDV